MSFRREGWLAPNDPDRGGRLALPVSVPREVGREYVQLADDGINALEGLPNLFESRFRNNLVEVHATPTSVHALVLITEDMDHDDRRLLRERLRAVYEHGE